MTSRVLNLLWLHLDLPAAPDPEDGSVRLPLPAHYIKKARAAAALHPHDAIDLWIDSKRLTERQLDFLKDALEDGLPNMQVRDLRTIPEYDREDLYSEGDRNPHWRDPNQSSLIWRQVDAAKILVCLQRDADQVFFADLDLAHLRMDDGGIQSKIARYGLAVGGIDHETLSIFSSDIIENQAWGFSAAMKPFFQERYLETLSEAYLGRNGWYAFQAAVKDYAGRKGVSYSELLTVTIGNDGSQATHTPVFAMPRPS